MNLMDGCSAVKGIRQPQLKKYHVCSIQSACGIPIGCGCGALWPRSGFPLLLFFLVHYKYGNLAHHSEPQLVC